MANKVGAPAKVVSGAAALAAMATIVLPFTVHWEGYSAVPYKDPVGIPTVCYGETRVEMRTYTKAECLTMLKAAIANDYGAQVQRCVPGIDRNLYAFAALTDAAYNAGTAAACRSPMAREFAQARWEAGCKRFKGWYDTARGVKLKGLRNRRVEDAIWSETALCMKGV